jgi:hypothetical protein
MRVTTVYIEGLVRSVAELEARGDLFAASIFAERLVNALDQMAMENTVLVVGDHPPEARSVQ